MHDQNRLANMILEHWKTHRPNMVADLERTNRLREAVRETESRAADLLYEFLSVRKMQYRDAWELAMRECLLPQEKSPTTSGQDQHATSG